MLHISSSVWEIRASWHFVYGNAALRVPQLGTGLGRGHVDGGRTTSGHSPGAALKLRDVLTPSALCCLSGLHLELAKVPGLLT